MYFKFCDAKELLPQWLNENIENLIVYNVYNSTVGRHLHSPPTRKYGFWTAFAETICGHTVVIETVKRVTYDFQQQWQEWCLYEPNTRHNANSPNKIQKKITLSISFDD